MLLGELEQQVLQYLWTVKGANAKQVHCVITKLRGGSHNTTQSTLERLFKKGLLAREKQGHAYVYRTQVEREDLIATLIRSVTGNFVEEGESSMVAAFSCVSAELDEAQLDELEQLIERRRSSLKKGPFKQGKSS
jgi:predicted transcriptional regulator